MSNQHIVNLTGVYEHTGTVISAVGAEHLELPTPCTEWNVRELLNHTIGVMFGIAGGVSGRPAPDGAAPDFTAGGGASAAFEQAKQASLAAWGADGVFDGTVNFGAGDMPAELGIGINMLDTLTHAWDLSEALGQDRSMDPALAEATLAAAKMTISDDIREGRFGPAVPIADDAPAHDRLAAFLGRHPS
ncbi:TIGR03086 family metal-binding protein [Ilumatobacter sp.]|uniref:TIGR03086 family metal-binding protein n=1 Tax=Ilumatobacter sp. TaxID=1967498 RepID=UPI003AF91614